MRMQKEKICRQYVHCVQKQLPCTGTQKKRYLAPLEESVRSYAAEHSELSVEELCEVFGTPEQVAATYLENEEPEQIRRRLRTRKLMVCLLVVVIIFGISISVIGIQWYTVLKSVEEGYEIEVIEELPPEADPNPTIYESH